MRLDKYLKVSRLIKRRTVANEVADAGRILINGKIAKASQAVKAGDIIEVTFGNRPIKVKVLSDVEPRTKDVAREMYEIIAEGEQAAGLWVFFPAWFVSPFLVHPMHRTGAFMPARPLQ